MKISYIALFKVLLLLSIKAYAADEDKSETSSDPFLYSESNDDKEEEEKLQHEALMESLKDLDNFPDPINFFPYLPDHPAMQSREAFIKWWFEDFGVMIRGFKSFTVPVLPKANSSDETKTS